MARGDIEGQTVYVMEQLKTILQAAGGTLDDVVKMTVYLPDLSLRPSHSKTRAKFFKVQPATTLVSTQLADNDFLLELDAIAVIDD